MVVEHHSRSCLTAMQRFSVRARRAMAPEAKCSTSVYTYTVGARRAMAPEAKSPNTDPHLYID